MQNYQPLFPLFVKKVIRLILISHISCQTINVFMVTCPIYFIIICQFSVFLLHMETYRNNTGKVGGMAEWEEN